MPDRFEKEYVHWIENLRDWCISRQIWYGHRIPVWYKDDEIYCGIEAPKGDNWVQDEDTLDTWFSSGMWTFSTLGWPHFAEASRGKPGPENDFVNYHPTTLMCPGYNILFLGCQNDSYEYLRSRTIAIQNGLSAWNVNG